MKTVFFAECNGVLYVKLKAIMAPMIAAIDGLSITFFGKEKTPYMTVDAAIEWCEKESRCNKKYLKIITVLKRAIQENKNAMDKH